MSKNKGYSVKQEIKDAVMRLMAEKKYMDITVTDIVNNAGVARASFYRNFSSINDVIDAIADEMADELIEDFFPILHDTDKRKWREFLFNHFYRLARRQKQMGIIRPENMSIIFTRIDDRIQEREPVFSEGTKKDRYLAVGKMCLLNGISKEWIDKGMEETPEKMVDLIMSFITTF